MSDMPTIEYYVTDERGMVRIEDLTREEAIAALKMACREAARARDSARRISELFRLSRARR